jgi:hypothetical protein
MEQEMPIYVTGAVHLPSRASKKDLREIFNRDVCATWLL